MTVIKKAPEAMTSKKRIQKTFALEKTDRVAIGYKISPIIGSKVAAELGAGDDNEVVLKALGVDYRGITAPYTGPELFKTPPDRKVDQLEGCVMRYVLHEGGGYWAHCDFPLQDATDEQFSEFPVPDPDNFDVETAYEKAVSLREYGLFVGATGFPDIINSNGRLMGMEDVLAHLVEETPAAIAFINKRANMQLRVLERLLDRCKGKNLIDFMWLGEDLGTQRGPLISLELYRSAIKPVHKKFADLASAYGIPTLIHTCGSSSWAYEDMIDIGIRGVDTLQPEALNMSPAYLVEHFGGRLAFSGCISTAGPLVYGTTDDVDAICRETLDVMMEKYGYIFAPTHSIMDNTPVENILAMYEAVHKYGVY